MRSPFSENITTTVNRSATSVMGEILGMNVIAQLVNPGTPILMGTVAAAMEADSTISLVKLPKGCRLTGGVIANSPTTDWGTDALAQLFLSSTGTGTGGANLIGAQNLSAGAAQGSFNNTLAYSYGSLVAGNRFLILYAHGATTAGGTIYGHIDVLPG